MRTTSYTTAAVGLTLLLAAATTSVAGPESKGNCEQLASRSANTASEHAMLAAYFRNKASDLRQEAARHLSQGGGLLSSKSASAPSLRAQLENESRKERMIADEYDRMAADHDAQATTGS